MCSLSKACLHNQMWCNPGISGNFLLFCLIFIGTFICLVFVFIMTGSGSNSLDWFRLTNLFGRFFARTMSLSAEASTEEDILTFIVWPKKRNEGENMMTVFRWTICLSVHAVTEERWSRKILYYLLYFAWVFLCNTLRYPANSVKYTCCAVPLSYKHWCSIAEWTREAARVKETCWRLSGLKKRPAGRWTGLAGHCFYWAAV